MVNENILRQHTNFRNVLVLPLGRKLYIAILAIEIANTSYAGVIAEHMNNLGKRPSPSSGTFTG